MLTAPPRLTGAATAETIRGLFAAAGYTEAALGRSQAVPRSARPARPGTFVRGIRASSARALLAHLFVSGSAATWADVHDLLGHHAADALRDSGLLTGTAECLATVAVTPVGERLVAHDRRDAHQTGAAEFVPGPGPATRRFADAAIRRPGMRVLDLGCGQGLLSLLAAEGGGEVTATDVNPRAVAFTAFNAGLNGRPNVTCVQGDLFAPVAGRRFDLVLANPPFVISPDAAFLYRDGRGICERIAREAPSVLADGGVLQMVCNWACRRGRDWKADLSAWFRDAGCDVWLLQTDLLEVASYAEVWLAQACDDPTELAPEIERWVAFYDEHGMEAMGAGLVAMRRRSGGSTAPPWLEIRDMPPATGPFGETIARVLEARDVLGRLDDQALLDAAVAIAPEARAIVSQRASASGWARESADLRLTRGLAMAIRLDPVGLAIAGYLDGTGSVRDAVATFAAAAGVPADTVMADMPTLVRRLVAMGLAVVRPAPTTVPS